MILEYELCDNLSLEASGVISDDDENGKYEHRCYKNGVNIEFVVNENEKEYIFCILNHQKKVEETHQ